MSVADAVQTGTGDDELPIENYAELTVAGVLPRLHGLSRTELGRVRDYERRHANRLAILQAIERALD